MEIDPTISKLVIEGRPCVKPKLATALLEICNRIAGHKEPLA